MDLATVKAAVKSWERSFRTREGRDPTKEDIKKDPGDISSQYALYRKLAKGSSSSSQSQSQSQKPTSSRSAQQRSSHSLHPPSSSTITAPSSSSSSQYRSTPRNIPSSEYPTTPTPPARRSNGSFFGNSHAGPSRSSSNGDNGNTNRKVEEGKSLKRKASKSTLSSSPPHQPIPQPSSSTSTSTSRTLFSTPKKKGYIGPIHDPNPINPFTITSPIKSPFPPPPPSSASGVNGGLNRENSFSSPFIHASSPKKLKEVLEANSLKKMKERSLIQGQGGLTEITPRTRARKRLKGEQVEDTPLKDKLPKKKRGQGSGRFSEEPLDITNTNNRDSGTRGIFDEEDLESDEEDELGPSPMKTLGKGRGFTSLFGEQEVDESEDDIPFGDTSVNGSQASRRGRKKSITVDNKRNDKGKEIKRGKPSEMMNTFFGRTGKSTLPIKKQENNKSVETKFDNERSTSPSPIPDIPSIQIQHSPPPLLEPTPSADDIPQIDDFIVPQSPHAALPDDIPISPERTPSASQGRREKVLSLSDDEIDEWYPEGGHVKTEIRIVPTRREVKRRNSSDFSDEDQERHEEDEDPSSEAYEGETINQDEIINPGIGEEGPTEPSVITSPSSESISMINLLSLKSPLRSRLKSKAQMNKAKLDELKVKAIFNPFDATKLKAIKKGQDISFTGETRLEDDNENKEDVLLDKYDVGLKDHYTTGVGEDEDEGEGGGQELDDDDWESESDGWKREQIEEDW